MCKLAVLVVLTCCELFVFVMAYSKVSKNGEARSSARDVAFTVSPVYVATSRPVDLRPGEAVNHPSTTKYSTLDSELLSKLDGLTGRTRAQERFHPPASFEHVLAHANGLRQQQQQSAGSESTDGNGVVYSKPIVSMTYDYPPAPSFDANSKPTINKPSSSSSGDSFPMYTPTKLSDSYSSGVDNSGSANQVSEYDNGKPSYGDFDHPPKSLEFPSHYDRPFDDAPSYAGPPDGYQPDDVVYDHIPDHFHDADHYHHHHHHPRPTTTTAEPEMMDQRLNKRPYSYYYIGKKLWYVPLYFSIYFIIYIAALVLKSIARHKINFPASLAAAAEGARSDDGPGWMDYVTKVLEAVEKYGTMT